MNFRRCRSSRTTKRWLPQETIKGMMRKTSFAVSTDESRYVLNGMFLSLKENKMTMVATDGRRLALVDEEVDIPKKAGANSSFRPRPSAN
jgi:DNA polymerase III sliding clamp (beta) subunit (PCNA family)